ncbi:MAG: hypothetical protein HKO65_11825 [Gemmatimonadetes bacterium]|nr:hypothetical protein [Gemmatimonadota bacterium]NNM05767.1 hypothetical protein [Gemmatimonadota bacterium]
MRFARLQKFRETSPKDGRRGGTENDSRDRKPQVAPFTVGLRIDFEAPAGPGKQVAGTKLLWISPKGAISRKVRSLKALLILN